MQEEQGQTVGTYNLIWFRNDLRTIDNNSLSTAVANGKPLIGVFCFDPFLYSPTSHGFKKTEKYRAQFLLESVNDLREELRKLNISLMVFHASPKDAMIDISKQFDIDTIFFQAEWTEEERESENDLKAALPSTVSFRAVYDQFLYHPEDIPFKIDRLPEVFTQFRKGVEKSSAVRAASTPSAMPGSNLIPNNTHIPTLEDLGFEKFETDSRSAFPFKGGQTSAMDRLKDYIWNSHGISRYKLTRNGLVGTEYSGKFSPWLANGSISPRTIYHEVKKYEREVQKNQSTYWMIFELIWRDYFKFISLKHRNAIFYQGGIKHRSYNWKSDPELITSWIDGTTPEPFVNANMLELKHTGWMSNRGRQNVASYFSRNLELDWRIGAAYFEAMLIDYDVHSNYGNWMYVAGVGNDPRDRKFNVQLQAERYDSRNKFQNLWLQTTLFS